jgi:proline dehydrogenase
VNFGGSFQKPADADYTRRLSRLLGNSTVGKSIRNVMRSSLIPEQAAQGAPGEEEVVDRTASETFLAESERALQEYAQTQQNAQEVLQRYQQLIAQAREAPGAQGSVNTMATILRELKEVRDTRVRDAELRSKLSSAIAKAPPPVQQAGGGTDAQGRGRRRAA